MKNVFTYSLVASVAFLFGIAFYTLSIATSPSSMSTTSEARTPSLVAGITALILATGLLVFGIVFSRKQP